MLHIVFQSLTALVGLWFTLHLIAAILMCYQAMLTRPKGLNLRYTLGGLWKRMWPMHVRFWYNPITLIWGTGGGIVYLKRRDKNGNTLHSHVSEIAVQFATEMENFPFMVLGAIAMKLNEAKIGDPEDDTMVHVETIIFELYRGLHPDVAKAPLNVSRPVVLAVAAIKDIYGDILMDIIKSINVKYPHVEIPVAEMEQRILHYCLFAAGHIKEIGDMKRLPLDVKSIHPSIKL